MSRPSEPTLDAAAFAALLDKHTHYVVGGHPRRRRKFINGVAVTPEDNRQIRRWRSGAVTRVSARVARTYFDYYNLPLSNSTT